MTQILRPRFGQPCAGFNCDETVPAQRVRILREHVEARGLTFSPSDILCVACKGRYDAELAGATTSYLRR